MTQHQAPSKLASMTGFARNDGQAGELAWSWELRSVNGRGLDLRWRLPPGFDGLEPALRESAGKALRRGNVTANLTVKRAAVSRLAADAAALDQALALALDLAARIPGAPPPRAEALLGLPGVLRAEATEPDEGALLAAQAAIGDGFARALAGLAAARAAEGARLAQVLRRLLAEIAALCAQAAAEAAEQPAAQRARLTESLRALLQDAPGGRALPSEERLAQEIALLATRADVTEELDRLDSHLAAAAALLTEGANVGRRLDFLLQEFNREANTLCSKSATAALTATGLKLKAAIEQLREQVQNVE